MANTRLYYNDLRATLSGTHTSAVTALNFAAALTHANGTNVPTLAGGDFFLLSVLDASGNLVEIVKVTAYTAAATSATVVRAQEGTPATAFTAGQKVVGSVTAASLTPDTAWTAPTFTNSWVNYDALDTLQNAGYRKTAAGLVFLRGAIKSGTIGNAAFTLPAGYRPGNGGSWRFKTAGDNAAGSTVAISSAGVVNPVAGLATYISLDGIVFVAEN